ncbi:Bug family tripartite tricarboxylate transporter substrate binding protein [Variovorax arabinosiphilus]|uniref:Bug family tripartite tricarboxylate transporter substrate binding protein n=1 Tax=Variovorax arabinosiphilus TaxID=3053498 RepID=UPI002575D6AE|nr:MULTISPECIES: tripartite tricarboxylate transporter substrate binding protein [unclassified Variovorax]MDM0118335.1 tripartite tricarboxylate transporter substrate binding protein [Variovorax sp. J2L1-78]MDM0128760.1 tripartite tricarboxylate transporter substrate binding protein [Variovorax sp. J2L1-63]MDM0233454.1 tripartite tricarboxylate transporter substrate binding protein [Variovorax sp. J2R1-6]
MKKPWLLLAVVCCLLGAFPAHAQDEVWPSKPIRVIVPTPPGGAYDRTMRPLAQELASLLKQPVVIDNKPGAGNIIGAQAGATAAPDGYTLTMTGMVNTIAQGLYDNVPFNIVNDFAHVAMIGGGAQWLVVNSQSGIESFADLIARAKREPGAINYASSGAGSTGHLVMELLQKATHTSFVHIPYKGGAAALMDVLGGQVAVTVIPLSGSMPYIQSGKLKVLAVSSPKRSPELPQVPTFEELGYKQLTVISWVGLSAPKKTRPEVVRKVNEAVREAMTRPEVQKKLDAEGITPMTMTSDEFTRVVKSDTERWGALTRSLQLKAN